MPEESTLPDGHMISGPIISALGEYESLTVGEGILKNDRGNQEVGSELNTTERNEVSRRHIERISRINKKRAVKIVTDGSAERANKTTKRQFNSKMMTSLKDGLSGRKPIHKSGSSSVASKPRTKARKGSSHSKSIRVPSIHKDGSRGRISNVKLTKRSSPKKSSKKKRKTSLNRTSKDVEQSNT